MPAARALRRPDCHLATERAIGRRPTLVCAMVAPGLTQVDLHLGYRQRWFDVALDIEDLLDDDNSSAPRIVV